jgi:hypothetical protein
MNPTAFAFLILVLSTGRLSAQGSFFEDKTIRMVVVCPPATQYLRPHVGNLHGQV